MFVLSRRVAQHSGSAAVSDDENLAIWVSGRDPPGCLDDTLAQGFAALAGGDRAFPPETISDRVKPDQ